MSGHLYVVSGFSGAGKGTLMHKLVTERNPDGRYALSVSMTTRAPRVGEQNGVQYFFVSKPEFEATIARGGLLEHTIYDNNYYGTPKRYVDEQLAAGRDVILEIEVDGGGQIRKLYPDAVLIFVVTPSADELVRRLHGRGTNSEEDIRRRLTQACVESRKIPEYDYLLVNDDLEDATDRLEGIIHAVDTGKTDDAEQFRPDKRTDLITALQEGLAKVVH